MTMVECSIWTDGFFLNLVFSAILDLYLPMDKAFYPPLCSSWPFSVMVMMSFFLPPKPMNLARTDISLTFPDP